jgi:hypothetical protein
MAASPGVGTKIAAASLLVGGVFAGVRRNPEGTLASKLGLRIPSLNSSTGRQGLTSKGQTRANSCAIESPNPLAIISNLTLEMFRFPRSTSPR